MKDVLVLKMDLHYVCGLLFNTILKKIVWLEVSDLVPLYVLVLDHRICDCINYDNKDV